jgi:peptidoglycan/LPS O-acetylase OafA/YrhL
MMRQGSRSESQVAARAGEIRSLTGLRGLAALLVVVDHYASWISPSLDGPWFKTGGLGMTIFFTLSGYVIALNYSGWDWRARPGRCLARFFTYRFARLYPAFLLFALVIALQTPVTRDESAGTALHLLLLQSWFPVLYGGHEVGSSPFHVSWSISAECGLYLLFALGMMVRPRLAVLGERLSWPRQ